jgi:hypothetical protein
MDILKAAPEFNGVDNGKPVHHLASVIARRKPQAAGPANNNHSTHANFVYTVKVSSFIRQIGFLTRK